MIFVLEIVAVHDIATSKSIESHDDAHLVALLQGDRIFPSSLMPKCGPSVSLHDLKSYEMYVDGMKPSKDPESFVIYDSPNLDVAESW